MNGRVPKENPASKDWYWQPGQLELVEMVPRQRRRRLGGHIIASGQTPR